MRVHNTSYCTIYDMCYFVKKKRGHHIIHSLIGSRLESGRPARKIKIRMARHYTHSSNLPISFSRKAANSKSGHTELRVLP